MVKVVAVTPSANVHEMVSDLVDCKLTDTDSVSTVKESRKRLAYTLKS